MFALLAILFIVAPLVELYVIIQVGQEIGALNTIGLLIIIALVGAWLAKHQGTGVIARIQAQVAAGQVPTNELIDGLLILVGGTFLLVPGFISDILGIFMLFPPTRAVFRGFIRRRLRVVTVFTDRIPTRRYPPDDVIDV